MKRLFFLFVFLFVLAFCYLGFTGRLNRIIRSAKRLISETTTDNNSLAPTVKTDNKMQPVVFTNYHKEDITTLNNPETGAKEKIEAWKRLSEVYLNPRSQLQERELVLDPLTRFVRSYILSPRLPDNPELGERITIKKGQTISGIAKANNTTQEAIKRLNNLKTNIILPGKMLKVLNKKITIFIDKSEFRLWLTYGGNFLLEMQCGIGKNNRTPTGRFIIEQKIKNPTWYRSDGSVIAPNDPKNELGSRWLGFKNNTIATGLGIHEAVNGIGVGESKSNGCIRLLQPDVELLYDIVPTGTTVMITN